MTATQTVSKDSILRMVLEVVGETRFTLGSEQISAQLDLNLEETKEIIEVLIRLGFLEADSIFRDGAFALTDRAAVLRKFGWSWDNPYERSLGRLEEMIDDHYRDKPVKQKTAIEAWERITRKTYSTRALVATVRKDRTEAATP